MHCMCSVRRVRTGACARGRVHKGAFAMCQRQNMHAKPLELSSTRARECTSADSVATSPTASRRAYLPPGARICLQAR
eukprot:4510684-Pleurochrysis_carterae.AAC.1